MPISSHHPLGDLTNCTPSNDQELIKETHDDAREALQKMDIDPTPLTMSDVEFGRITEMIVVHMKGEEALHGEEEDWEGVKHSQLVEW